MPDHGVIYTLREPQNPDAVRYVGKTTRPDARGEEHCANRDYSNIEKNTWIRDLQKRGFEPKFEIEECGIPVANLNERETVWVKKFSDEGHKLLNRAVGAISHRDLVGSSEWADAAEKLRELRRHILEFEKLICPKTAKSDKVVKWIGAAERHLLRAISRLDDLAAKGADDSELVGNGG